MVVPSLHNKLMSSATYYVSERVDLGPMFQELKDKIRAMSSCMELFATKADSQLTSLQAQIGTKEQGT